MLFGKSIILFRSNPVCSKLCRAIVPPDPASSNAELSYKEPLELPRSFMFGVTSYRIWDMAPVMLVFWFHPNPTKYLHLSSHLHLPCLAVSL